MKILAIQNRMGIGDMVIFLPFIDAIAKKYNCPIDILVKENSKASQILHDNKNIGKIIILDRDNKDKNKKHDGLIGFFALISDLKKYDFDKVFIFNSSLRFRLICKFAVIKKIYQYPLFKKKNQHIIQAAQNFIKKELNLDVESNPLIELKDSLIQNFKKHQNKMFYNCLKSINKSKLKKSVYYLNKHYFKKINEISFDYAILEKSKNINAIKLNMSLSDLGNWKEIWKYFKDISSNNFIKKNTYYRPWGKFINLHSGKGFLLKEIIIKPKSSISLQKHRHRSERWIVISGKPKITINNKKFFKKENEGVFIPKGAIHRIENLYKKKVQIVEAQIGSILKESDIIRYKDIYGRVNQ